MKKRAEAGKPEAGDGIGAIRTLLLGLVLLGIIATSAELILLEHTEEAWQLVPVILLPLGLIAGVSVAVRAGLFTLRLFRVLMTAFVGAGCLGLALHYRGNVEFELEMYPGLQGLELFRKAITGATPALAPGMMIHLGLLGLVSTYRHPILSRTTGAANHQSEGSTE